MYLARSALKFSRQGIFWPRVAVAVRSYSQYASSLERRQVTLIPGDGVGPEITGAVVDVFKVQICEAFDHMLRLQISPSTGIYNQLQVNQLQRQMLLLNR